MPETMPRSRPTPGEPQHRFALLIAALVGAVVLGAIAAQQRAEAKPVDMDDTAALSWMWCPPNACNGQGERPVTTIRRRPPTTIRRPHTTIRRRPPTTIRRPHTTIRRRPPTTIRRPHTTIRRRPPTTIRRPPPTTRPTITVPRCGRNRCRPSTPTTIRRAPTTRRPPTTTRPPTSTTTRRTGGNNRGCGTWACSEVRAGIKNGYLPPTYNPHEETSTADLVEIINNYGNHNDSFDTSAALRALREANPDRKADRGDMFLLVAAGLGIPYDPTNPMDVADELADRGILLGHDRDGDGVSNPYIEADADPGSRMTNQQLAAFLNRISTRGGGVPTVPPVVNLGNDRCAARLFVPASERSVFASQLEWRTPVGIGAHGEPGVPWPPHPDVPGGMEFLVVAESPVWPVVDRGAAWRVTDGNGCLWEAASVETRVSQMLPWRTRDRLRIESSAEGRPGAGFDTYLSRWDNVPAEQQERARQSHRVRDVSEACPIETAGVGLDSYDQCRWVLPAPGVWSWEALACFEAESGNGTSRDCETLAQGVELFLEIIDYTSGITLQHDPSTGAGAASRQPGPNVG